MKKIVFIFLMASLLSLSCSPKRKPGLIIYLIPEGYTGGVLIAHSQPDGITPETNKDGNFALQIPKDGFLKVKSVAEREIARYGAYYVDENDNLTRIEYLLPHGEVINSRTEGMRSISKITEDETNNGIFVMNHRSIGIDRNGSDVKLFGFSVGHPKDADSLYLRTLDKFDKISEELYKDKTRP